VIVAQREREVNINDIFNQKGICVLAKTSSRSIKKD
jgi:hypothetical protein